MGIGSATLLGLGAMGMVGGIGSAAIGANAAGNATSAEVGAANYAAQLQQQEQQANLAFQEQMFNTQQSNMAPWLNVGGQGENSLAQLMGLQPYSAPAAQLTPVQQAQQNMAGGKPVSPSSGQSPLTLNQGNGVSMPAVQGASAGTSPLTLNGGNPVSMPGGQASGSLPANPRQVGIPGSNTAAGGATGYRDASGNLVPLQPWTTPFQAPTNVTEQNDPGYKFRLQQGEQALDRGAAAQGTLLSGAGIKPYERFAQDYASNEYGNVYNRAMGEYQQNYNINQNNQANEWNRFASLAGLGQTAASQLNSAGGQIAGNVGNSYNLLGSQLGQDATNVGAARASGYNNAATAWAGGLSGGTNNLMQMILMSQMGKTGAGDGTFANTYPNSYGMANS